jgi:hypothetical protein
MALVNNLDDAAIMLACCRRFFFFDSIALFLIRFSEGFPSFSQCAADQPDRFWTHPMQFQQVGFLDRGELVQARVTRPEQRPDRWLGQPFWKIVFRRLILLLHHLYRPHIE